ncbi:hypothetical protein D3C73_1367730 [compost metagenome]
MNRYLILGKGFAQSGHSVSIENNNDLSARKSLIIGESLKQPVTRLLQPYFRQSRELRPPAYHIIAVNQQNIAHFAHPALSFGAASAKHFVHNDTCCNRSI